MLQKEETVTSSSLWSYREEFNVIEASTRLIFNFQYGVSADDPTSILY